MKTQTTLSTLIAPQVINAVPSNGDFLHRSPCRSGFLRLLLLFALAGFALFPTAHAVVPPPDGGYPNFNTAEGQQALFSLTTGQWNTASGAFTLWKNTDGSFNTAVGTAALLFNIGNQSAEEGIENTAVGAAALLLNTTGSENTAVGVDALLNNTEGDFNTATGAFALSSNTTGQRNTATGDSALFNNTTGSVNTAIGNAALVTNTTGNRNTAIGGFALQRNNSFSNTAIGVGALSDNTGGFQNTATGDDALADNTEGIGNTATGFEALVSNTFGVSNTALGAHSLDSNTFGDSNTAIGAGTLSSSNTNFNTAVGAFALSNTTGSSNIALGAHAGDAVSTASNVIAIGVSGGNVSNTCYIGNIWNQPGGSQAVYVNSEGKLGAQVSSRRFKGEIKPIDQASEAIHRLRPVSFRYKAEIDPTRPVGFGLIAEEVEKINPDLVTRDKEGKPSSVRYDQVNAMLLNEFLKEHKKLEEQGLTITELKAIVAQQEKAFQSKLAEQQRQVDALASDLRKVSVQLEVSRRQPVNNDH